MSNMYTILDSLKKVTPKQEPQENKKPQAIYESVEAKGSILEGVAKVEQKLKEQFAKFNEGDTEYKNGVTKHKGTYGTEYQGDPDDEDAPKRGRPAKGTAKKEKVVRVKGPKGRPKKDPAASAPAKIGNDPFGRVPDKAPKGAKGTVVKGKATQDTNEDQINELSPELLKRARDKAGEKWSAADDRRDQKASDKYNAQDDKFNSALRKKQKDMDESAVRIMAKPEGSKVTRGTAAYVPKNSIAGKTPQGQAHRDATAAMAKAARAAGGKLAMNKTTDVTGKRVPGGYDAMAKGVTPYRSSMEDRDMTEAENPFASFKKQAKGAGLLRSKTKTKTMESSLRQAKLLIEGVNFTEMVKKKDMTLQEMLAELQADIQAFKETGHCSELLRDCMEVHSYGKSQLNDATENPMDNDNFPTPLAPAQAPSMMDRAKRFGSHVLNKLGHGSDEDLKADLRRKMDMQEAAELNELARLAGLTVNEGAVLFNGQADYDRIAKWKATYMRVNPRLEPEEAEEKACNKLGFDYEEVLDWVNNTQFDEGNDGNLANNAKPYNDVTQADVVAGRLGNDAMGGKVDEDLQADDGQHYDNEADFFGQFEGDHFDEEKVSDDGMEVHGYIDGKCVMVWRYDDESKTSGYGNYDDSGYSEDDYRNFGSDYDGANEDPRGWDDVKEEGAEAEASGFYVNYEIRTGDPERVAGPFASQQEAQAWINDNVPNPSDEPYYNISQVGFNEDDMEEGNEFSGNRDDAIKAGKTEFEVDGKTYPVQEGETCPTCKSEPCACEDTEAADRELAKLKENCGIVSPIGSMAQDMQQQQGKMSINTNQSSDGTKNISISADGEAADQLMQILKMAGMAGGQQQHAEVVVTAEPMEAKEYGNTDIDKPKEVVNTPRPDVRGMHRAETVGYADTTDDLNKQKDQDPETANRAANPKTPKANRVEESSPLESLGAKLMAEYQAIKITK